MLVRPVRSIVQDDCRNTLSLVASRRVSRSRAFLGVGRFQEQSVSRSRVFLGAERFRSRALSGAERF